MRLLVLLLVLAATMACGEAPTSPSREKVQPVPTVIR